MALDGILLYKIMPGIQECLPARIKKIYQISPSEILFQIHGPLGKKQLLISCHTEYNRLLITERSYPTPDEPGNFIMVLRKYLEGGMITEIAQAGLDRWCTLSVRKRNEMGDLETWSLIAELMGKYANVILVNAEGIIVDALKRIPPFENMQRIIQPGVKFTPAPAQNKRNPFADPHPEDGISLLKQFSGFSPLLSAEAEYRMASGQSFASIMQEIQDSDQLYIANDGNKPAFHCIELKSIGACRHYPLYEGFDILYYHKEEKDRIREITGDIYKVCRRELKHQKQKLPRLLKEMDEAMDCDRWNRYGELLYMHQVNDTKGQTSITLNDYETNEPVKIPLDARLDGKGNARRCYAKYSKLKKGQKYLQEQIGITENEISYFTGLLEQLDQADFDTAEEIKQELIKGGYIAAKQTRKRQKKHAQEGPHISSITLGNGVKISYGKNNLQNDALTWHHARRNEIWLHAKDYHGSHVVIHESDPDEYTLRLAAEIAAYFSAGRNSSSVPVNYCPISQLKKIPGAKPGMVQLGSYKTIYIDPSREDLEAAGIETD